MHMCFPRVNATPDAEQRRFCIRLNVPLSLFSALYHNGASPSFNSSGRSSNCDDGDMHSDVSLEEDVNDLSHKVSLSFMAHYSLACPPAFPLMPARKDESQRQVAARVTRILDGNPSWPRCEELICAAPRNLRVAHRLRFDQLGSPFAR
jgi:hypothetical protein